MSGFVHLHCHTTWSLMDGAIPAESLPHAARYFGFEAIAMTDHDSLTGAVRFARAARSAGVKPIYGAELTLNDGSHVTALAKNATGYGNLCRLITDSHLTNERGRPGTTFDKIVERADGLFILSGCKSGPVARLAAAGDLPRAEGAALQWRAAIGDDFRIEVFDHRGYGDRTLRNRLLAIAKDTGIPAVATNNVHYPAPTEAGVHELLHAMKEIVPLSQTHVLRQTSEYYLKDALDMAELFYDYPDAVDETWRIAEACEFDLDLDTHHFPELAWLEGISATGELARRCFEGANRRYPTITREIDDRLQHELRMINKMGFAAFFLLVADIVHHTKNVLGIRCSCRGSAAGSLVCFVLGISDVDPVRYDLLFERFMNERREEIPDIDIDVESHRREEVLTYILDTYGREQTAMCCMVDTFRARGAIREVGKALGMPQEEIDVVAKAFPRIAARDIPAAIDRLPELIGSNLQGGQLAQLFNLCQEIDGFPRHLALHPSGVILSSPDLGDRVPMQESYQGFTMLQADKDDVEELGLAKLDVLGLRMYSTISHAVGEIERSTGDKVDLDHLTHDDAAAFRLIRSSKTLGCFQIESPGQRELLARYQPTRFDDLITDISLFRPGPVKSDMVSPFLNRRHGFEDTTYSHDVLEPILAETNGVVVYHEQVIRVIAAVTGCSLADADYVRRHLDAERPAAPQGGAGGVGALGAGSPRQSSTDDPGAAGKIERRLQLDPDDRPGRKQMPAPEVLGTNPKGGRGGLPSKRRSSSHPGMGRGFREEPEAIQWGSRLLGEDWTKNERVVYHGVAGEIEIKPPEEDVAQWFVASAIRNGFSPVKAKALWKEVFSFASFGFCKSHAAAFALPTYLSSWLKAHHPAAFLAGVLTHEPGMYPRRLIVADARHFGIPILGVDVNHSDDVYRVEVTTDGKLGIRMALRDVRDISDAEVTSILEARAEKPFASLEDLWRRTVVSRPVLENLVHIGALDTIEGTRARRELLWRIIDLAAEPKLVPGGTASASKPGRLVGIANTGLGRRARKTVVAESQMAFTLEESVTESLPGLPAYSPLEEIEAELEVLGVDARGHVMSIYEPLVRELGCIPGKELIDCKNDSKVWVAGVKVSSQTPAIRSGQRIIFVTLDDVTGPIDVTVFERVQPRCARTVFHSWIQLVHGVVRKRGGASRRHRVDPNNVGITVVAEEVFDLVELSQDRAKGFSIAQSINRQRRKQAMTGLRPPSASSVAGDGGPPAKLWHSSGGSAGR